MYIRYKKVLDSSVSLKFVYWNVMHGCALLESTANQSAIQRVVTGNEIRKLC